MSWKQPQREEKMTTGKVALLVSPAHLCSFFSAFSWANHIKGCKVYKTQFSIFTAHFCSIKCGHITIRHPSLQHSQPPKLKLGHHSALNTHTSFPLVPDNNRDFRSYLYKCGYFDVSYKWNHTVFVLSSFYTFLECYPIFFLFPSKEVKFSSVVNYSPDTVKKLFFFFSVLSLYTS